ncbi:MAG: metallophosphoesterase [Neptuniibacter sp.]
MSLVIVHLSDIHIKTKHDKILAKGEQIAGIIRAHQGSKHQCFIVVSGDIAFSGNKSQYELAQQLLSTIVNQLTTSFEAPVQVLMAPGNHDCDFTKDSQLRNILLEGLNGKPHDEIEEATIAACAAVQDDFFAFRDNLNKTRKTTDSKLWTRYDYEVEGKQISFDCLNFAWSSKLQEGQGELIFPIEKFHAELEEKSDLRIFLFHHPMPWIRQGQYQTLRSKIRANADIVLTGHEHYGSATEISDKRNGDSVIFEGACLQENGQDDLSEFNIINIDPENGDYQFNHYVFRDNEYRKDPTEVKGSIFAQAPRHMLNGLSIQDEHMAWLIDPGANFTHPYKQNIELSDIFIYPELEPFSSDDVEFASVSSKTIIDAIESEECVLIKGEEQYGKTALLKTFNTALFDGGYAPLFIDSTRIGKASNNDLNKIYRRAIGAQYGQASIDKYLSICRRKKVILLDSFDKSKVKDRFQHKIVSFFRDQADKVIVTANDSMEFSEVLHPEISEEMSHFAHFKLNHFGNNLRYKLIKKWRSIGSDYNLSEADLIARVDHLEKLLNSVIGKNLVPKVPFFILTILQSLESTNQNTDFHNSGLGHYYHYLITESLGKAHVKKEALHEYFSFLSQLAWFIYHEGENDIDETRLRHFVDQYSAEYTRIDASDRLKRLVEARILSRRDRFYAFSYPYTYFYFLGRYLSKNLVDEEVQGIISNSCKHIYMHDHANIVMFVAHHAQDRTIIPDILANLRELFNEHDAITFDGDTDSLNQFVGDTAQLIYRNSNPDDVREEHTRLKDELEKQEDPDVKQKECESELDLMSKLNKLMKTMEILGQLLKSYYGSIRMSDKQEMVAEVFNAPMRALKDFYCFIEKDSEALIGEIEGHIKSKNGSLSKEKTRSIAERLSYEIIGAITAGMVIKPASAVASTELREVIDNVVQDNPTTAFKLIKIASELELPQAINFSAIKKLGAEVEGDMFSRRILQSLALKHLYLFKVEERDKQSLCEILDISIDRQNRIDYTEKGAKLN